MPEVETIVAEPIKAYRVWTVGSTVGWLEAFYSDFPWRPDENGVCHAQCTAFPYNAHPDTTRPLEPNVPYIGCTCGFWAFKEKEDISTLMNSKPDPDTVWGEVELWGKVVEGTKGYRAQYARPTKVYGLIDSKKAENVARLYKCETSAKESLFEHIAMNRIKDAISRNENMLKLRAIFFVPAILLNVIGLVISLDIFSILNLVAILLLIIVLLDPYLRNRKLHKLLET